MVKRRRKGPVYRGVASQGNVRRSAGKALISSLVLFAVIVIAGVTYAYFSVQKVPQPSLAAVPAQPTPEFQELKHPKPPVNAPVGVAVEAFSSLVKPGDPAYVSVRTLPGATCKIQVLYNKVADADPELKPQAADDFGSVTWNWHVSSAAPAGMWPANVTCQRGTKSGFVQANIAVSP